MVYLAEFMKYSDKHTFPCFGRKIRRIGGSFYGFPNECLSATEECDFSSHRFQVNTNVTPNTALSRSGFFPTHNTHQLRTKRTAQLVRARKYNRVWSASCLWTRLRNRVSTIRQTDQNLVSIRTTLGRSI